MSDGEAVRIEVEGQGSVSGLWLAPPAAMAALVLAHGAGAGMTHRGMAALAAGLAARQVATLRFQFPFMERGSRRPDPPAIAQAAVRAAVAAAGRLAPALPLFAGGRSFGGRMTAYAEAEAPLPAVRGLVFFAFPLHPAGKPATDRAVPLAAVALPMLFLQGTADDLARLDLLQATVAGLGPRAQLELAAEADHDFHVPKRTGRSDTEVLAGLLDATAAWMAAQASARA